jgi:DHA2 family multidrug resistance protein-like MFS transporter
VGNVAVIVGVSAAIGPTVAGLVLSVAPWEALFLLNVPVGLLAFVVGLRTLPNVPGSGHRFDVGAALLSAATFGLVISGVNGLGRAETLVLSVGQIGLGLLTGAAFARSQLRQPAPMLPVDLLRRPVFALSAATSVVSFSAQAIAFVCLPFFIYGTLGRSPAETGLLMTPWPIATALAAFVSGRLADRLEPGPIAALGLAVFAAGLMSLALLPGAPDNIDLLWRLALAGLGFGIFQAPNNKLLITSAPSSRSGGASGIQSTGRLLGQSLGVAMLAVIFGLSPEGAFPIAMWLATVLALSGVLPSALRRAELHH